MLRAGLCLIAGATACGPSIQSIHEGSVRFEHCYRLDLDPKIAPAHRHACWEQWLKVYSFGQSRDRLEHARERVTTLEAGDPNPPTLDLETSAPSTTRQFYMSTPAPVIVHAPTPPAAPTPTVALEPTDACVAQCAEAKKACLDRCAEGDAEQGAEAIEKKTKSRAPQESRTESSGDPEASEESADSKCGCVREYKLCGARCFE
jgi:hypothetical protein